MLIILGFPPLFIIIWENKTNSLMKYTREQISKVVKNIFSRYDLDEDGFLNKNEVTLLMNETYQKLHKRDLNQLELE